MSETTMENKAIILADLWQDYRDDEEFTDFMTYNDLGLPLSYAVANGIAESNPMIEQFISETFRLLLVGLEIKEDTGFETLDDILSAPMGE